MYAAMRPNPTPTTTTTTTTTTSTTSTNTLLPEFDIPGKRGILDGADSLRTGLVSYWQSQNGVSRGGWVDAVGGRAMVSSGPSKTCEMKSLENVGDSVTLLSNGWNVKMGAYKSNDQDPLANSLCSGVFHAWSSGPEVGYVNRTMQGSGTAVLTFGNCWNKGTVSVYVTQQGAPPRLLSNASPDTINQRATFEFTDGDVLVVKDEGANSVVWIKSLVITCNACLTETERGHVMSTPDCVLDWGNPLKPSFTVCTAARYNGPNQNRIFSGSSNNWLHGFSSKQVAVSYFGDSKNSGAGWHYGSLENSKMR